MICWDGTKNLPQWTYNLIMAERMPLDIAGGFYEDYSPQLAALKCINLYPFAVDGPAYSQTGLRAMDGIKVKADTGLGSGRGSIKIGNVPYFVLGTSLISIDFAGNVTNYGSILGTGQVSMAQNGKILWVVVPGIYSYYLNLSTGILITNLDPNFLGPATSVEFKDSFFVFTTDDIIFNSNLDGVTFSPTDQGVAEVNPDKIVRSLVDHNQLYILGVQSIQVFQTITGTSGFPFASIQGAAIEKGLAARFAVARADNTFFWLGSGGGNEKAAMYKLVGNQPGKISTPAIDNYISGLFFADVEACTAQTWQANGETFISFSFPKKTFVYLVSASAALSRHVWVEQESSGSRHRSTNAVEAYSEILCLDTLSGKIGALDKDVYTEYDDVKTREFTTQPFNNGGSTLFANSYEMKMETGVGNADSLNPVISHSFSDNGINFFDTLSRPIGRMGVYDQRVVWRRMGRIPQQRVLKYSITEPCKVVMYRIEAEINV